MQRNVIDNFVPSKEFIAYVHLCDEVCCVWHNSAAETVRNFIGTGGGGEMVCIQRGIQKRRYLPHSLAENMTNDRQSTKRRREERRGKSRKLYAYF